MRQRLSSCVVSLSTTRASQLSATRSSLRQITLHPSHRDSILFSGEVEAPVYGGNASRHVRSACAASIHRRSDMFHRY